MLIKLPNIKLIATTAKRIIPGFSSSRKICPLPEIWITLLKTNGDKFKIDVKITIGNNKYLNILLNMNFSFGKI
jgi:hypothetical protein